MESLEPKPNEVASRPPVIIIGAHRSGTSATARALRLLGLQLGQQLDSHDEPRELQRVHENYLHHMGGAWHKPGPFLASLTTPEGRKACTEYLSQNIRPGLSTFGYRKGLTGWWMRKRLRSGIAWGWKEPRTTLFASCWLELFPNARILHVVRNPLAVATSIQRRELEFQSRGDAPNGQVADFDYCVDLAMTYVEVGESLASQTSHFCRVRFEDLQGDPSGQLAKLAEFCELRVKQPQIKRAAVTIRPTRSDMLEQIAQKRDVLTSYPLATKLGYH